MQKHRPIPIGLKFNPSDEDLIECYLYPKVCGQAIPFVEYFVRECNIYGEHEPSAIWNALGGPLLDPKENLYVFTQLKKKGKGSRINRQVASSLGAWEGEKAAEEIVSTETNLTIGYKKRFRYEGEASIDDRKWIMEEYSLHPSLLGNNTTDYVLCGIRKNETKKREKQETCKQKEPKGRESKKRKREGDQSECVSEATMVIMLKEGTCYDTEGDSMMMMLGEANMKMIDLQPVVAVTMPNETQQENHSQPACVFTPKGADEATTATFWTSENIIFGTTENHSQPASVFTPQCPDEGTTTTCWTSDDFILQTTENFGSNGYDLSAETNEIAQFDDEAFFQLPDLTVDDYILLDQLYPLYELQLGSMAEQP